jgi:hypothetical protein
MKEFSGTEIEEIVVDVLILVIIWNDAMQRMR